MQKSPGLSVSLLLKVTALVGLLYISGGFALLVTELVQETTTSQFLGDRQFVVVVPSLQMSAGLVAVVSSLIKLRTGLVVAASCGMFCTVLIAGLLPYPSVTYDVVETDCGLSSRLAFCDDEATAFANLILRWLN